MVNVAHSCSAFLSFPEIQSALWSQSRSHVHTLMASEQGTNQSTSSNVRFGVLLKDALTYMGEQNGNQTLILFANT